MGSVIAQINEWTIVATCRMSMSSRASCCVMLRYDDATLEKVCHGKVSDHVPQKPKRANMRNLLFL